MTDANMLTLDQTVRRVIQMLVEAGVNPQLATLAQVWPIFQAFARLPVEGEAEVQVLVQWGIYNFYLGRNTFQLDLTRQYMLDTDNESEGIYQLHCVFFFEPTPDLTTIEGNMWSMDYADLDTFYAAVEAQSAFTRAIALGLPIETRIEQEEAG